MKLTIMQNYEQKAMILKIKNADNCGKIQRNAPGILGNVGLD
jgi:hypothetical protein